MNAESSQPSGQSRPSWAAAGSPASSSTHSGLPSAAGDSPPDWRAAFAALEQTHNSRLAQIEERLAVAERTAADLAGQIQEMR